MNKQNPLHIGVQKLTGPRATVSNPNPVPPSAPSGGKLIRTPFLLPENTDENWILFLARHFRLSEITRLRKRSDALRFAKSLLEPQVWDLVQASDPELGLHVQATAACEPVTAEADETSRYFSAHIPTPHCTISHADLLAEILLLQADWYRNIKCETVPLRSCGNGEVWTEWAKNPRDDCIYIGAVRRTRPTWMEGRVKEIYFPVIGHFREE